MTVFLDANVVMYLVGAPHPNRDRARQVLDDLILADERLATDAEVYQEVLHRYAAIRRIDAVDPAFTLLDALVDECFPVTRDELDMARSVVLTGAGARDAVHVATMRSHGVRRILTFDRGFDRFDDLDRLS